MESIKLKRKSMIGFGQFDLVCVIGVIAILSAIALPNFLTAQTQSKVSRVKKEMRLIGIAMETYKMDNNAYPWLTDIGSGPNNLPTNGWTWCGMPLQLSTPIAYIRDANVWDPFPDLLSNSFQQSTYRYMDNNMFNYLRSNYGWTFVQTRTWVGDWVYPTYYNGKSTFQPGYSKSALVIVSNGPDLNYVDWIAYDPTNGTISNGDIEHFGP